MVSIKEILKNTVFLYIILSALFFFFAIEIGRAHV